MVFCRWCRRSGRTLTKAGLLRKHASTTRRDSIEVPTPCPGSGRKPADSIVPSPPEE